MKLTHIVLPTDLSPDSDRPFAFVTSLAKDTGAKITLLAIVENVPYVAHGAPLAPPLAPPDLEPRRQDARKRLEEMRSKFPAGVQVLTDVVDAEDVAHAISKYAKENGADLVALSTHGRTGWRRAVLGSVSERVVRESEGPVLTFHRK